MMLQFGTGWRDRHGRQRTLIWLSDPGWVCWDNGYDVHVIRRGMYDEISVRARLLGWDTWIDDPAGPEWAESRMYSAPPLPRSECPACQGEGWVAGPEGAAVLCGCADRDFS